MHPAPRFRLVSSAALAAALLVLAPACSHDMHGDLADAVHGEDHLASDAVDGAADAIDPARLARWTEELSTDDMQGRLPGTEGEERATAYIAAEYKKLGLQPANEGSYFQEVPLVGITARPASIAFKISGRGDARTFRYRDEFVAGTTREKKAVEASGELVFVGYGTVAPEFEWDDYKGVDVAGKILVMLVNDPPLADESRFGGRAMTYYGRWTYKYEIGAEKKAAGVILVHETEAAGYPWGVVSGSWSGEQFVPARADAGMSRLPVESWVTSDVARDLFKRAGLDFDEMKKLAATDQFRPIPMALQASFSFKNDMRRVKSKNVAGLLPGTDLADEWVLYTAHWDHLGVGAPDDSGDDIYNGAFDNATGVAGLLGIAEAFGKLPRKPRRSILFLAVTAEEQGLIGSTHYSENPLHPLERTAALINMDGMNIHGRTEDVIVVGLGNTTLDDLVSDVARAQGRRVTPDAEPEKGFYYRSDQFPFAKKGVPALYTDHGVDFVGRPDGWGLEQNADYTARRYHKPSDEFDPEWDFSGMEQDLELLFRVGVQAAESDEMQQWKDGTEFKAVREESLARAGR